jgi:uncharacterized protein YlxW (UPF0749 family)
MLTWSLNTCIDQRLITLLVIFYSLLLKCLTLQSAFLLFALKQTFGEILNYLKILNFFLLLSMVDKDAKVREMRRENLLLTSKIQLLEDQMENLNERVDRTLRERNQLRREINSVRFDSNLSIEVIFHFFLTKYN